MTERQASIVIDLLKAVTICAFCATGCLLAITLKVCLGIS